MRRLSAFALVLLWFVASGTEAQGWGLTRHRPAPTRHPGTHPRPTRAADPAARREVLIRRYRSILTARPAEAMAFERLVGLVRERDGGLDRLTEELRTGAAGPEAGYATLYLLARLMEEARDPAAAAALYERAQASEPARGEPALALARLARAAGDGARAAHLLEAVLPRVRDAAARRDLLRQLGDLAIEADDLGAARSWYAQVRADAAAGVFSRAEYARALARHGRHVDSATEYAALARSLRGDPRVVAPLRREQARQQLEGGDAPAAIETARGLLRQVRGGERAEVLSLLEEAYRTAGRLSEFAEELTRTAGRSADLWALAGRLRDEAGDAEGAMRAYHRALTIAPRALETRERLVHALVRVGRLDDAVDEARALVAAARSEPRYLAALMRLLVQSGRRDAALAAAARASRTRRRDTVLHRALAEIYDELGEEALATAELERVLRSAPRDVEALVALGTRRLGQDDRAGATALFRRIVRANAGVEGHLELGQVFADHDMLAEAERELRVALRLAPQRVAVIRALASVLEREWEGDSSSARVARQAESSGLWGRVIELATDDASRREAREHMVWSSLQRGSGRQQMAAWRGGFAADPPDLDAGRYLAAALLRQRPPRRSEAADVLERIIEHSPGDLSALRSLERVRTLMGDRAGAIVVLRRMVTVDPRRAAAYLGRMSEHAHALYQDDNALTWAAEAAARAPRDAAANVRLGDLLRARQDTTGAVAAFERALRVDPRLYAVRLKLAEMLMAHSRTGDADTQYKQVLRGSLDDELVLLATRASMRIHVAADTLPELEASLLPLAVANASRPIYRRLLVEIYDRESSPWLAAVSRGGAEGDAGRARLEALGERALSPLLEALADSDPSQRGVALRLLGRLGRTEAAPPLLALAERDGPAGVRVAALLAASAICTTRDVPRLLVLARDPERRLHVVATFALAHVGGRPALAALRASLAAPEPEVRAFSALGLGAWLDASSLDALIERLARGRSSTEVAVAAWSVSRLLRTPRGGVRAAQRQAALAALLRHVSSPSPLVASSSAIALATLDPRVAAPRLAALLFGPGTTGRRAAAAGLAWGGSAISPLVPSRVPMPYAPAADTLRALWRPSETRELDGVWGEALASAASRAMRDTPMRAAWTLRLLASPDASLAPLLRESAGRSVVAASLMMIRARLEPELLAAGSSDSPELRRVALLALSDMPAAAVLDVAASALSDEDSSVRRAALALLMARDDVPPEVVPRVVDAFARSERWPERLAGAQALGHWADPRAIPSLVDLLTTDRYAFVREAAATALGRVATDRVRTALSRVSEDDPEPRVRAAAGRALGLSPPASTPTPARDD